jgi:hypothetical protein
MSNYECSCFLKREFEKYGHDASSSIDLASEYKLNSDKKVSDKLSKCLLKAQKEGKSKKLALAGCKEEA